MRALAILLVLVSAVCQAQTRHSAEIDRLIRAHVEKFGVVGLSVAVAKDGQIVEQKAYGFADLEHQVPVKPETKFRLASISKPVTAVAVMKLVEQGKVKLEEDARTYAPKFPQKEHPFTVRQLLCHQSGIRHYRGEAESKEAFLTVEAGLRRFADDPLLYKPGERYLYSTYAYTVLGLVIEGASGKEYRAFLEEEVFRPAGMANTLAEENRLIIPNRARGYRRGADGKPVNSEFMDNSYKWAGGGLVSTASDMARFGSAILQGKLLKPETVSLMWTPQIPSDNSQRNYCLGWTKGTIEGQTVYQHGGSQTGARSMMIVIPDKGVSLCVLTNYENNSPGELAVAIASLFAKD